MLCHSISLNELDSFNANIFTRKVAITLRNDDEFLIFFIDNFRKVGRTLLGFTS